MVFNTLLLDTLEGKKVSRPPVWFMRQAGRYMSEYRAIRENTTFLELCKNVDLAVEVTKQPVNLLGVDAAILFSDILTLIEPMGIDLSFSPAPTIHNPIRTIDDVNKLKNFNVKDSLSFVYKIISKLVADLHVPLIGFSGAPFTLACYMVEGQGSKHFLELKKFMYSVPKGYELLMSRLTDLVSVYLRHQYECGCQVVQIFDTWAGLLSSDEYRRLVLPYVSRLVDSLKDIPVIYFAKDAFPYFNDIKTLNCVALGIDWRTDLLQASAALDNKFILQGNFDPSLLFTDKDVIYANAKNIIEQGKKVKGHIFNLGHGIMPSTPVENVKYLVDVIKE